MRGGELKETFTFYFKLCNNDIDNVAHYQTLSQASHSNKLHVCIIDEE